MTDDLIAQDEDLIDIEPVAYRYGFDGYGWQYIDNGSGSDWRSRHPDGEPLYAHSPADRIEALEMRVAELEDIAGDLLTRFEPWSPHDHDAAKRARAALKEIEGD